MFTRTNRNFNGNNVPICQNYNRLNLSNKNCKHSGQFCLILITFLVASNWSTKVFLQCKKPLMCKSVLCVVSQFDASRVLLWYYRLYFFFLFIISLFPKVKYSIDKALYEPSLYITILKLSFHQCNIAIIQMNI